MQLCKLCNSNEANQTGSHLMSAFMVKTMIGERDQEVGHLLSKDSIHGYRENVGAKPIKQDYILCLGCEKRLSFLESYISSEFTQKIDEERFSQNFPVTQPDQLIPFKTCNRVNARAFALQMYSVIWRASISEESMFKRFNLESEIDEDFRRMLHALLPPYQDFKVSAKPKDWIKMLNESNDFVCYPFVAMKCNFSPTRDKSRNMIFTPEGHRQPYQMLANEYLFFVSKNPFSLSQDYFQIAKQFGSIDHLVNLCNDLKIGILSEEQWNNVLKIPRDAIVQQQVVLIKKAESERFFQSEGRLPTEMELRFLVGTYIKLHWPDEGDEE
jgi:hypothetical protein